MRIQISLFKLQGGGADVRDYRTGDKLTAKSTCARCRLKSLGKITNPAVPRRGPIRGKVKISRTAHQTFHQAMILLYPRAR